MAELWSAEKPFDCVGERSESAAAVAMLSRLDGWAGQAVIVALSPEAATVATGEGHDLGDFLTIGALDGLPAEYRPLIAGLAPALADVATAVAATRT